MRRIAVLLALLAGCRTTAPAPAPSPAPPPNPPQETSPALDEASWRTEMEKVLFEKHMRNARLYRDGGDFEKALAHVDRALSLEPASDDARELRVELQRLLGQRAGEVRSYLEDEWLAQKARDEQRVVDARRWLKEAQAAEAARDYDRAIEAYNRALYLAGEDRELKAEIEAAQKR